MSKNHNTIILTMKAMRIISTLAICLLLATVAMGQAAKLRQAKQAMANLDYIRAIELYNEVLEEHDVAEAKINLAEAYRKINDTANAEYWYGQVVRLPESEPIHKLYYGMMLQRNGRCEEARNWYDAYTELVPNDERGQYLKQACDYEDDLLHRNLGLYEIKLCDFNSRSDDFGPQFYRGGLVFSSERDTNPIIRRTHTWTGNPFLELYYLDMRTLGNKEGQCGKYIFGRPEKFSNEINSKYHDASISFSKNGEEVFFTRNNFADGKKGFDDEGIMRLKIFYARSEGHGKWGKLESLPFNSDEYSVAHPALSPDGNRLYFASDMPGGFGGMDLYYSDKENGRWGPPQNLGPTVNTEGHEIFPTVAPDGQLYFASDGHIGLGGLDVFSTKETAPGTWSSPENLGAPINSHADDFGIIFNREGTCGFFTSNRDGGIGKDDIYSFRKTAIPVEVLVYDQKTDLPLQGAQVFVACMDDTLSTDAQGKIHFHMKLEKCCDLTASMTDYEPAKSEACTRNMTLAERLEVKIPMLRMAEFIVEGVVFDAASSLPLEGAMVTIFDEEGQTVAPEFITPNTGKYYFKLERDRCYRVKAEKNGYFAGVANNVCTKGLESSETLRENLYLSPTTMQPGDLTDRGTGPTTTEETPYTYLDPATGIWMDKDTRLPADGRYPDGRLYEKGILKSGGSDLVRGPTTPSPDDNYAIPYLVHIYYDFDKAYIRDDAIPELEKLYQLMIDNPQYIIEIGSHTDSRGSYHYNQRLSQRRAEAVVRWLTDRGIDRKRLVARGYGENKNVNHCKNNVPCSEKEHQLNRRTEFKVIGCLDCIEPEKAIISHENPNVKVDECKACPF